MNVQLLAHTPAPEQLIAASAKLCYSAASIADLAAIEADKAAEFIEKLPEAHQSPFEHVSFTFGIEGVSRAMLAQITRHRIASFSVQSQRYVEMGHFGYVVPQTIAENDESLDEYQHLMCLVRIVYNKLIELDIPAEDARFVLPNACATRMIVTMNARELLHFFSLRCCKRAQWEIRAVADEMLRLCKEVAPTLFAKAGAGCVRGHCPEGKTGCKHGDAR
jgi:thymidylate synthase (FAD)